MPSHQPTLPSLFNTSHINHTNPFRLALLAAYSPFGCVLFVLRLSLFLTLTVLISVTGLNPSPALLRALCLPFGLLVSADGPALHGWRGFTGSGRRCIITPNHVSAFDVVPLRCLVRTRTLMDRAFFGLVRGSWADIVGAIWVDRSRSKEQVREDVAQGMARGPAGEPVVVFPEGWDTSGRVGLLRFNKGIFETEGATVIPCAIRVNVCMDWMLPLVPGALGVALWSELAWLFFQPGLHYRLTFLDPFPTPNSRPEAIQQAASNAEKAQRAIATHLKIEPTHFTNKDTLQWRQQVMKGKKE
jgi:1-acyl-sn-glycerol-3-phosphate acyltransferase